MRDGLPRHYISGQQDAARLAHCSRSSRHHAPPMARDAARATSRQPPPRRAIVRCARHCRQMEDAALRRYAHESPAMRFATPPSPHGHDIRRLAHFARRRFRLRHDYRAASISCALVAHIAASSARRLPYTFSMARRGHFQDFGPRATLRCSDEDDAAPAIFRVRDFKKDRNDASPRRRARPPRGLFRRRCCAPQVSTAKMPAHCRCCGDLLPISCQLHASRSRVRRASLLAGHIGMAQERR